MTDTIIAAQLSHTNPESRLSLVKATYALATNIVFIFDGFSASTNLQQAVAGAFFKTAR